MSVLALLEWLSLSAVRANDSVCIDDDGLTLVVSRKAPTKHEEIARYELGGTTLHFAFKIEEVNPESHQPGRVCFPFGQPEENAHIACSPIDATTCRGDQTRQLRSVNGARQLRHASTDCRCSGVRTPGELILEAFAEDEERAAIAS